MGIKVNSNISSNYANIGTKASAENENNETPLISFNDSSAGEQFTIETPFEKILKEKHKNDRPGLSEYNVQYLHECEGGHPKVSLQAPPSEISWHSGLNGLIDENVEQGETGDCWLIAGVNALNRTEKGRQIIKNSVIPNNDGSVTVNFAGEKKSYTLTSKEIQDGAQSNLYSKGDKDMLVIELAAKKLFSEKLLNDEDFMRSARAIAAKSGCSVEDAVKECAEHALDGGNEKEIWKALTPNYNIKEYKGSHLQKKIDAVLKEAVQNKNLAVGFALGGLGIRHEASVIGSSELFSYSGGKHAFTINEITDTTVTFSEPSSINKKYTMTQDEFKKLAPIEICSIDLTDA